MKERNHLRTKLIEYATISRTGLGRISGGRWNRSALWTAVSGRFDESFSTSRPTPFLLVNRLWHDKPVFFRFCAIQLLVDEFLNGRDVEGILFIGKAD